MLNINNLIVNNDNSDNSSLPVVQMNSSSSIYIIFTDQMSDAILHQHDDFTNQCRGEDCFDCKYSADSRLVKAFLLPVYSLKNDRIEIVEMEENYEPTSLLSQVRGSFEPDCDTPFFITFRETCSDEYECVKHESKAKIEIGQNKIAAFMENISDKKIKSAYKTSMTEEEFLDSHY